MMTRSTLSLGAALFALVACGGDDPAPDTTDTKVDTAPDTDTADTSDTTDTADPNATACCPLGTCPSTAQACIQGACVPRAVGAGACYFDTQCGSGATCVGATFCECGSTGCEAKTGTCAYPEGCCNGPADCEGGAACVDGVCRAKPATANGCWVDAHCEGGLVCEGEVAPPCGSRELEKAGVCAVPGVCCESDAECGDGVCRGGRCLPAQTGGGCWADGECGVGETCLGESLCPCAAGNGTTESCAVLSAPGRCGRAADACCAADSDCAGGEICVAGECGKRPSREDNECWVDAHCGVGRVCEGANLCGCNEDGCTESQIGTCKTVVTTCETDAQCPASMRCASPDRTTCPSGENGGGVCVERVDVGCWDSGDCVSDQRCGGEVICTDPAGCAAPNKPGSCQVKADRWDCCDSHMECKDGFECRNSDSSVTCPPTSSAVCLPVPQYGERCWNVMDCPDGMACNRVWICGCNGKCYFNYIGQCEVPLFCDTDLDCGTGYTCAREPECLASPCTTISTCQTGGRCQVKVEGGCWSHDECGAGKYCEGLKVCPAELECPVPDQPGICADRAGLGECCTSFRGCDNGLRCVSVAQRTGCKTDFTAVCVPAVTPGSSCFADDDCDTNQRCEGQRICACGVESCAGDEPVAGTCRPK